MVVMVASAPRFENGFDLDSLIRKTRTGAQRDVADAIDHAFEVPDPLVSAPSDGPYSGTVLSDVKAPPGAAMLLSGSGAPPGPDARWTLLPAAHVRTTALAQPHQPSLGRAPPSA